MKQTSKNTRITIGAATIDTQQEGMYDGGKQMIEEEAIRR